MKPLVDVSIWRGLRIALEIELLLGLLGVEVWRLICQ